MMTSEIDETWYQNELEIKTFGYKNGISALEDD